MRWLIVSLLLPLFSTFLFAADPPAADKPVPAKDATAKFSLPEGFRATLFAGEPDVVQPIAFTFDDRGRIWVVECLSYPKWSKDGKGKDRVTIYEDTDQDGVHDKRTVFLDNGVNLSGIEFGFGGIWLCSSPNLLFVPDRDQNDKPDGPPEVVLDGWNMTDTIHNVYNSLAWGPDGWLYGLNGIQAKAKVGKPGSADKDRVAFDCGVWRYHPTRKTFEVFAWGTTNPWGLDWDQSGELFITNCVIEHIFHMAPGGHYKRMYGQDPNPLTYDLMQSCTDHLHWAGGHWTTSRSTGVGGNPKHSDFGGGHAHVGCAIYLGDNFPAEYHNNVFMCNLHGNRLNRDTLHRSETGYVAKHAKDFLFANDTWFRGLTVKYGPDGGMYVSDWTDTGECHNYQIADMTNGRIFKVTYGQPKAWSGDLARLSDPELIQLQQHKNEWFARKARRILQERAAEHKLAARSTSELRNFLGDNNSVSHKLRALWTLHAVQALTAEDFLVLMKHPSDEIRAWAVTFALDPVKPSHSVLEAAGQLARSERSVLVRMRLAGAVQRLDAAVKLQLAPALFSRELDNTDANLSLMLWYAIQSVASSQPDAVLALLADIKNNRVREFVIRAALTSTHADPEKTTQTIIAQLQKVDNACRLDILRGMREAFAGRRDLKSPAGWAELKDFQNQGSRELQEIAEELSVTFQSPGTIKLFINRISDPNQSVESRRRAISLLASRQQPGLAETLRGLLTDPALRASAIRALASYADRETPAALIKHYATFTNSEKADAIQTLATRSAYSLALLEAVEGEKIPKTDVTVFTARQIQSLNDKNVNERLTKVWGTIRPASATQKANAAKYKKLLTEERLKTADATQGRAHFVKHCASCHKLFGEGGEVGPELTGSQRTNLDYLLENVLDPSAVVPGEFRMTTFNLNDGRTLTGVIRKETAQAITIRTINEEIVFSISDIEQRKATALSIMPDGLFENLKEDEVRDLVAYLASQKQVPLPPK